MRYLLAWLACCAALALPGAAPAQTPPQYRGVYASIRMGPTQDMIERLGAAYGSDKRAAIREVRANPGSYLPPVLYALANALAEDYAEEAIFWYHVGRLRAVYDGLRCRDESARTPAMLDLRKRMGLLLRSAQFYRRERLPGIAQKAVDWDAKNPRDYDQRWVALYGNEAAASAGADGQSLLLPEAEWPAILKHVHETHLESVRRFAAQKPAQ